jgi:hypothetical protein
MSRLIRQLECLNCSNKRNFVHHTATGKYGITSAEATVLPARVVLTCGRCGSPSLVMGWDDPFPYRAPETIFPRRHRSGGTAVATPTAASTSRSVGEPASAPPCDIG